MLTYPQKEEVGLLNLESSTRIILNKNSWSIFEIWLTSQLDSYDKLHLIAELHIKENGSINNKATTQCLGIFPYLKGFFPRWQEPRKDLQNTEQKHWAMSHVTVT